MNIINLCNHEVVLLSGNGEKRVLMPSGHARCKLVPDNTKPYRREFDPCLGIDVIRGARKTAIIGLPDPVPGTVYLVSSFVLEAAKDRNDLYGPGTGPYDGPVYENGRLVGVTALRRAE